MLTLEAGESRLEARRARHVAIRVEDGDIRCLRSIAEGLQHPLVRLVRGVARDRELLEPAAPNSTGREDAEGDQEDPGGDNEPVVRDNEAGETFEHP